MPDTDRMREEFEAWAESAHISKSTFYFLIWQGGYQAACRSQAKRDAMEGRP